MGLDVIWKFIRYLIRNEYIEPSEGEAIFLRIIRRRIKRNSPDPQIKLFQDDDKDVEIPF